VYNKSIQFFEKTDDFVLKLAAHKPYGEIHTTWEADPNSDIPNFFYTGKLYDDDTGLYYYGARHYNPALGRFTQADTVIPSFTNPQSLNAYSYCDNNPINYIDPTGHFKLKKWIGKIVGAICAVAVAVTTGDLYSAWQMYSLVSGVIDSGIAMADGADPLKIIGANAAAFAINALIPGAGDGADWVTRVGVGVIKGTVAAVTTAAITGHDIGEAAAWGAGMGAVTGFASSQEFQNFMAGDGFVMDSQLNNVTQMAADGDWQAAADRGAASGVEGRVQAAQEIVNNNTSERLQLAKRGGKGKGGRRGSPPGRKKGGRGKAPDKNKKPGVKKPKPTLKPGKQNPGNPPEIQDWGDGKKGPLPPPSWPWWGQPKPPSWGLT